MVDTLCQPLLGACSSNDVFLSSPSTTSSVALAMCEHAAELLRKSLVLALRSSGVLLERSLIISYELNSRTVDLPAMGIALAYHAVSLQMTLNGAK